MMRCRSVAVVLASSVCAALPSGASAQMIVLSDDFETGDLAGVLGRLPLGVV